MKLELALTGMHCDGCVRRVTNLLGKLEGVAVEAVSVGHATVELSGSSAEEAVRSTLSKAGFGVERAGGAASGDA